MKIRIVSQKNNSMLKRREVTFEVEHGKTGGTPTRFEVRKLLASVLNVNLQLVYVKRVETKTGTTVALGEANAYDFIEQARLVEPKHIISRNTPPEKTKE